MGDAITAYRSLDRPGAPPAMRQNALFAAAELELRAGRKKAALRDFEAAIVASPEGALREDAMARAMDTAQAAGAMARAERAARRYLSSFPDGNAAGRARQILGGAGAP
jgi:outer membrane protein assembly factor BamD (BamD/ComL family)